MADADIYPLVYSLCEQRRLPILVTDLIACYLEERDILTISTLSQRLREEANPVVYRNIVLDLSEPAVSGQKALLLLRTLLTSRTAAGDIRSLSLTGDPLSQWRNETLYKFDNSIEVSFRNQTPPPILYGLSSFTPKEIELYWSWSNTLTMTKKSFDSQISLTKLCFNIISLITRLQDLHISSDYFRYPDFRKSLIDMVEAGSFQNLQSSSFCLDLLDGKGRHIKAVRDWDDALLTPFLAPNIKSIATVMTLEPEALSPLRVSSITRLVLHHCQVQHSELDVLLASTPRLRYLEYHASVDYGWCSCIRWSTSGLRSNLGLDPLFDSLHHVSDTLEELVTSQKFRDDRFYFHESYPAHHAPLLRQRDEMLELKHLHTLSIPWACLLGWTRYSGHTWKWPEILPASLRQITLTDDLMETFMWDAWTDEALMPIITSLLDWMTTSRQDFQPLKFTLRLNHLQSDFNESERQTLSRLCEERGIICSIIKTTKDLPKHPSS